MRRLALLLSLLLLAAGCQSAPPPPPLPLPGPATPTPTPKPKSAWTVLLYVDADNDLEESEIEDLREMLEVGSTDRVQLVALVDRAILGTEAEGYTDKPVANQQNWTSAKLLHIEKDRLAPLEDWGEVNMADPDVLSRFCKRAGELYPAERYALFLMDHGEAWAGICYDDSAEEELDLLTPGEIGQALEKAGFTAEKPLDLAVLDACVMGSLEMALGLAGHVEWLVASEEIIPLSGLDYKAVLKGLTGKPEQSGRELGQSIVSGYLNGISSDEDSELTHLALVRLKGLEGLRKLVESLAAKLNERLDRKSWLRVARARRLTEEYGRSETPLEPSNEMRDLAHLSEQLQVAFPDLAADCRALRRELRTCINRQVRGRSCPNARGLSIFFPPQAEHLNELAAGDYPALTRRLLPEWTRFLLAYTRMERKDIARARLADVVSSADVWRPGEVLHYQSRLANPEELESCSFVLVQNGRILGQTPSYPDEDSTLLQDSFDGTWLALNGTLCPLHDGHGAPLDVGEHETVCAVAAQLARKDRSQWIEVTVYLVIDLSSDELRGHVASVVRTTRGSVPLQLRPGDRLRLVYESSVPGGHPQPGEEILVKNLEDLIVQAAEVPAGDYRIGFMLKDLHGETLLKTVPVKVE